MEYTTITVGVPITGDVGYVRGYHDREPFIITRITNNDRGWPVIHGQRWDEAAGDYVDVAPFVMEPSESDGA